MRNVWTDAIHSAADSVDGTFHRSYSGRGMGSKTCVGVEVEKLSSLVALGAAIAYEVADNAYVLGSDILGDMDGLVNDLQRMEVDNMGLGYIVYWQGIEA